MKKFSKKLLAITACSVIFVTNIAFFILLNIKLHKAYKYFTVLSYTKIIVFSILVLLPAFVSLFSILYITFKKTFKKPFIVLLVISIIISFAFSIAMNNLPAYGSCTSDKNNYLKFDALCPLSDISYSDLLLPSIPEKAENTVYFYDFYLNPDTRYDVFLQITLPRAEYEKEKSRLLLNYPNVAIESYGNFDIAFISDENKTKLDEAGFGYSDEYLTIRYFISFIDNVDINNFVAYYKKLTW